MHFRAVKADLERFSHSVVATLTGPPQGRNIVRGFTEGDRPFSIADMYFRGLN